MAAPVWRRHTAAGVVVMLVCSLGRSFSAQGPDYRALVDAYAAGRTQEAVEALATWPEPRLRSSVRVLGEQPGLDHARAAAMLHTEAAVAVGSDRRYLTHLNAARSLVHGMSGNDRASLFTQRWHAWAVALHVARNDLYRARQELTQAVGKVSDNKDLVLAAGIVIEMGIRNDEHNLRGLWNAENRGRLEKQLQAAVWAYQRAVAMDPAYLEARLRLGWTLLLSDSQRSARDQLEHVAAHAARADLQYLAHLFLGAVAEREKRVDDAVREYEAAHAAGPHQASFVALMRLEQARGHDDRARSLAADFAAQPVPDDDPLRYYDSGITSGELLEWLRREARKQ
jgi:hypothetical protein